MTRTKLFNRKKLSSYETSTFFFFLLFLIQPFSDTLAQQCSYEAATVDRGLLAAPAACDGQTEAFIEANDGDFFTMDIVSGNFYTISMCPRPLGGSWDTAMDIWDVRTPGSEVLMFTEDDHFGGACNDSPHIQFTSAFTGRIQVNIFNAISCASSQSEVDRKVTILCGLAPANDDCGSAAPIAHGDVISVNTLISDSGATDPSCAGLSNDNFFYSYTATATGRVTVTLTPDSWLDAEVGVYNGCPTSSNCVSPITVTANPTPGDIETAEFDAVMGTTYIIAGGSNLDDDEGGGQFTLTLSNATLPVELQFFSASVFDKTIVLDWSTASEQNNDGFEIQRSMDGINFSKIGWLNGKGNSDREVAYQYIDSEVLSNSKYYYRLRQVDFDGAEGFSQIEIVETASKVGGISIQPNPLATGSDVRINVNATSATDGQVLLFDIAGKIILDQSFSVEKGRNPIKIASSALTKGNYIVKVILGTQAHYQKLIVQ